MKGKHLMAFLLITALVVSVMSSTCLAQEEVSPELRRRIEVVLNESRQIRERPLYFQTQEIQDIIFSKLDEKYPMPNDFYEIRTLYLFRQIRFDPEKINENYWKHPDWWPNYEKLVVPILKTPMENRQAIWCVGVYPSDYIVKIKTEETEQFAVYPFLLLLSLPIMAVAGKGIRDRKKNAVLILVGIGVIAVIFLAGAFGMLPGLNSGYDEFDVYVWVRSAPLVEEYIGVKLNPVYPPSETADAIEYYGTGKVIVEQDPGMVKNYIKLSMTPDLFVLEPGYPIYYPEYVKMIKVHVKMRNDTPKGKYVIGFDTVAPPKEFTEEQLWKYKLSYTDPNTGMACGPREFRLFIIVE